VPNDEQEKPGIRVPRPRSTYLPYSWGCFSTEGCASLSCRAGWRLLGWPLVGGGMTLAAWFARTMRRADTTMHINMPVSRVVQDGPFRFTRNPDYLSLTMLYVGIAVLRNALWAILLLPLVVYVIQREVVEREVGYLERTFGEEYLNYKARVRRWV
jgi:protein-S-isoprenylcysteine O-methyltransferase Ste14